MISSSALRIQIESDFEHRYPSVLTPATRTIREVSATGIPDVDELLDGGLPVGAITEITGPATSGRTTIAMAFVAQRTKDRSVCGWIDARDTLDPESAAANGICLKKLLWVRCRNVQLEMPSDSGRKSVFDKKQHWTRLDQAIRATDLLLQSGGFAAVVLDLANESVEHCRRIPLATWFRFRQAAERTRCSLVVLSKSSFAQSSAAVVLECQQDRIDADMSSVIREFSFSARRKRERYASVASITRKAPASTWSAQVNWNAEKRA